MNGVRKFTLIEDDFDVKAENCNDFSNKEPTFIQDKQLNLHHPIRLDQWLDHNLSTQDVNDASVSL